MDFLKHNRDRLIQAGVYVALINYKESRDLLVGYFRKHPSPFTVLSMHTGKWRPCTEREQRHGRTAQDRGDRPGSKGDQIIGIEREDYLSQLLD
jgi:hypothetical protein